MQNIPSVISQTIDVLSEKFGATGIALWGILIKQMYIYGYECLFFVVLSLISGTIGSFMLKKAYKNSTKDSWGNRDLDYFSGYLGFWMIVASIIIFIVCSLGAINYLGNPQYQAIQSLLPSGNE